MDVMSDHTTALVPLETWAYHAPLLRRQAQRFDVGLLAEALVYYDRVVVVPEAFVGVGVLGTAAIPPGHSPPTPPVPFKRPAFVDLVDWFASRGALESLISLLRDGSLEVLHYQFWTMPFMKDGSYIIVNSNSRAETQGPTFTQHVLQHASMDQVVSRPRQRQRLYAALDRRVTEVPIGDYALAGKEAQRDYMNPTACVYALQVFLDEIFPVLGLQSPPQAEVVAEASGSSLSFNVEFDRLQAALGPQLSFAPPTLLSAFALSHRLLWTAAERSCDLFLPDPMSPLINAKLVQALNKRNSPQEIVSGLKSAVAFPDIRTMVNSGSLSFEEALAIRSRAGRFRGWLQQQAERDADALIAYHHEVAQAHGLTRYAPKVLKMLLAGGGAAVGDTVGGLGGAALGAVLGPTLEPATEYALRLALNFEADWKPVVFGTWMREFTERARPDQVSLLR